MLDDKLSIALWFFYYLKEFEFDIYVRKSVKRIKIVLQFSQ